MSGAKRQRFEPYLRRLHGYAFSLTQDASMADDLVQDTVVRILSAKAIPKDEGAYRAWMFRILRNRFIDTVRSPSARERQMTTDEWEARPDDRYGSEMREVNAVAVRIGFGRLSLAHREIIGAIDISGHTYKEAAQLLEVAEGTIMSRISRARSALYRLVEDTSSDKSLGFLAITAKKIHRRGK